MYLLFPPSLNPFFEHIPLFCWRHLGLLKLPVASHPVGNLLTAPPVCSIGRGDWLILVFLHTFPSSPLLNGEPSIFSARVSDIFARNKPHWLPHARLSH